MFYDKETKLCKAHEYRPSHCKAFPFYWNIDYKTRWDGYQKNCEGIGQGPIITEGEILEKLRSRKTAPRVPPRS